MTKREGPEPLRLDDEVWRFETIQEFDQADEAEGPAESPRSL
jgi:hypothetical protein